MIIVPILGAEEEKSRRRSVNIKYYITISYVRKGILNINMIPGLGGYPNLTLVCTIIGVHSLLPFVDFAGEAENRYICRIQKTLIYIVNIQ